MQPSLLQRSFKILPPLSQSLRNLSSLNPSSSIENSIAGTSSKMAPPEEEDLERKLKKEQKAKLKEEKKLKAAQKAEAAKLQAQKVTEGSKKSEKKLRKREADDENPEDFIDPATPAGEKKQLSHQMAKQYSPSAVEKSWYSWWERSGFFVADPSSSRPPFTIDTIIRWRRMSGDNT